MTIVAEAWVGIVGKRELITGVIGRKTATTRTETTPPIVRLEQVWVVTGDGAVALSQLVYRSLAAIEPNGDIIRFAPDRTSARKALTVAGQTGPPAEPQPASAEPVQYASTDPTRAPSRAAWES